MWLYPFYIPLLLVGSSTSLVLTGSCCVPISPLFLIISLPSLKTLDNLGIQTLGWPRSFSSHITGKNVTRAYFSSLLSRLPHCASCTISTVDITLLTIHLCAPIHTETIFHPSSPGKPFKAQRTSLFFSLPFLPSPFTFSPFLSMALPSLCSSVPLLYVQPQFPKDCL